VGAGVGVVAAYVVGPFVSLRLRLRHCLLLPLPPPLLLAVVAL
jgi:hypothetical protein